MGKPAERPQGLPILPLLTAVLLPSYMPAAVHVMLLPAGHFRSGQVCTEGQDGEPASGELHYKTTCTHKYQHQLAALLKVRGVSCFAFRPNKSGFVGTVRQTNTPALNSAMCRCANPHRAVPCCVVRRCAVPCCPHTVHHVDNRWCAAT